MHFLFALLTEEYDDLCFIFGSSPSRAYNLNVRRMVYSVLLSFIHWIAIFQVDTNSVIHPLNNQTQVKKLRVARVHVCSSTRPELSFRIVHSSEEKSSIRTN